MGVSTHYQHTSKPMAPSLKPLSSSNGLPEHRPGTDHFMRHSPCGGISQPVLSSAISGVCSVTFTTSSLESHKRCGKGCENLSFHLQLLPNPNPLTVTSGFESVSPQLQKCLTRQPRFASGTPTEIPEPTPSQLGLAAVGWLPNEIAWEPNATRLERNSKGLWDHKPIMLGKTEASNT